MRLYMWGIGGGTAKYIGNPIHLENIEGFILSSKNDCENTYFMDRPIYSPKEVCSLDYDAIVVGSVYVENIFEECKSNHIDLNRVIFLQRAGACAGYVPNIELLNNVLGKEFAQYILNAWHVVSAAGIADYDDPALFDYRHEATYATDYVRFRTLELLAREISLSRVEGAVAELGVFRGEFTKYMNQLLPNRKTYLFDTFEGFDPEEASKEIAAENLNSSIVEAYKNTCIDVVLRKLSYPKKVEFRKGYFPDSLAGLEDHFAFASIDVDLEESIYHGLEYFCPRMNKGGYIMIHDYNSFLKGVSAAIRKYESAGHKLNKVPIPDNSGTLVLAF